MWEKIVSWFKSLFCKKPVEQQFSGWIQDDVDPRDQVYGGSQRGSSDIKAAE